MKKTLFAMLIPAIASAAPGFWEADVWNDVDRGFLFYGPTESSDVPKDTPLDSLTKMESLQAERDRRLHRAIMTPTPQAIASYQEVNTFMLEKSALFADMWRRSLWAHPQYDFTTRHPAANFAQVALNDTRQRVKTDAVRALGRDWGLIFVVDAECEFCDLMAPIGQLLTKEYGLETLVINLSSRASSSWPDARPDNGTIARLAALSGEAVTTTPTLFMVHRDQKTVRRVASGVVALEELVHRLYTLANLEPGRALFGGNSQ